VIKLANPSAYIKIARFDHWIKQLFILPGFWLAIKMVGTTETAYHIILVLSLGLLCTSIAASANYCINEWLDSKYDKFHPVKKNRPFVVGKLNPFIFLAEYLFFSAISIVVAFKTSIMVMIWAMLF